MRLISSQTTNPGLLQSIIDLFNNVSFVLGIVLGVFVKMIVEAIFKRLPRWINRSSAELTVYTDYTCEVSSTGVVTPIEPHLIVRNRTNDRLSISRIVIHYGERSLHRITKGVAIQRIVMRYSSPMMNQFDLDPKSEMKVFVNITPNNFEIVATRPDLHLGILKLTVMPPDVMRYATLVGTRVIGKSEWFDRSSIRPRIRQTP